MRVIVTGGTGLIGRALSASLASDGHEVLVLSRDPARARNLPEGVQAVRWDARTAEGWGHLAEGAWAIVNLAGASIAGEGLVPKRWTPARKDLIRQSRLQAGRAVVEAVARAKEKPRVVVQASGIGYYGPRGSEVVTEEDPPGRDFLAGVARDWEAVTAPVEEWDVRRVVIRTAVVLSREGGVLPLMLLPFRFFVGGPLGSGHQWVPWIHIADEVRAIRFLMEREDARGPFNLASPNPVTNEDLSRIAGRVLRRPSFVRTPAFALRLALGELATILLDGQRAAPKRLQALGFTFQFPDLEGALRDLLA